MVKHLLPETHTILTVVVNVGMKEQKDSESQKLKNVLTVESCLWVLLSRIFALLNGK